MLSFPFVLAALALSFAHDTVLAARVTIEGRPSPGAAGRLSAKFDRRVVGSGLSDRNDLSYYTNVTIGGVVVEANIDTGSSDLWTDVPIRQSTDTGKPVTINYAIGAVTGTVHTATLQFAGYTVQNQAFLQAKRTTANDKANQHALIGLGPDFGSRNFLTLNGSTSDMGDTPLGSIFKQDPSTPNFISFILGRADDNPTKPEARFPGELSIGEVIPGYEAINSQPKMTIPDVQGNKENQHYSALLDSVKVRGASVQLPATTTTSGNNGKLVAVFDSGFSLPQVPKSIVDAMYSSIPGAKYGPVKQLGNQNGWVMDCKHEVTGVSFTFNGLEIPIHPLDVTAPIRFLTGNSKDRGCLGLWQEIGGKGSGSLPPGLDVLLGMAFLRNTYMLINVGDFVEGGTNKTADPFIQMLPLTNDTTRVHNEFVNARTNLKNGNINAAANVSARGSGVLIALLLSMGSALWL